jgi:hypothetical protein
MTKNELIRVHLLKYILAIKKNIENEKKEEQARNKHKSLAQLHKFE